MLVARRRGWPHQGAWFSLGSWGTIINILALVWGGLMVINIAHLDGPGALRRLRQRPAQHMVEPVHQHVHQDRSGRSQEQLPAWPIFETLVGTVLLVGALYYLVAQRGKLDDVQVEADLATGEAVIG